jgi:RNA polymerase-interacting CarD/CdnL/TRCF family regulator
MEKQTITQPDSQTSKDLITFETGTTVIYPMHGKCTIVATENRQIDGKTVPFYRIEIQKSSFSRSSRQEPTIWVPVASARDRGLRLPLNAEQAQAVQQIFSSREYFFDAHATWATVLPQLEQTIRAEGGIGLAKVASYLFVLKKRQVVPTQEVAKFSESVNRMLFRELSEVTGETIRELEVKATKSMRPKLLPDN